MFDHVRRLHWKRFENIRTVSALTQEDNFRSAYAAEVAQVYE